MGAMALLKRWNPEPWHPTPEQEKTAVRLSDSLIAARGRDNGEGTVELRTLQEAEVRRYVIYQDGTATLLEARPASTRYRRMEAVRTPVGWVAILMLVWVVASQAVDFHEETLPWAAGTLFVCFMGLFATEIVMNSEIEPAGEQWQRVGGSD
jgi:hypothetical protein